LRHSLNKGGDTLSVVGPWSPSAEAIKLEENRRPSAVAGQLKP
jgi:hypothetical protein